MPRFVILYHECPAGYAKPSHWDFMLEANGVLLTWELRALPARWSGVGENTIPASRLADHRLQYLEYEGPISGDRGTVKQVAAGTYELLEASENRIRAILTSSMIQGTVDLKHISDHWELTLENHDEA